MPRMSSKNFAASPAALQLGLGDQLAIQLQDQEEERKRKLKLQQSTVNPVTMGPAAQSLLAPPGGGLGVTGFFNG